ncbi:FCD domain-containing protein [Arcanobacterium urinimassiliense]|uniref:FCD domain-containing protein n=1 Tax=Arcanobacterium urinimassiliense TaxID=1871014 RepID=UPI00093C3F0F
MRQTVGSGTPDGQYAVEKHRKIVEAFETGDEATVVEAMRFHLENVLRRSTHDVEAIVEE